MAAAREGQGQGRGRGRGREEQLLRDWESQQVELRKHVIDHNTEDWQNNEGFEGLERVGGVDLSFIKEDEVNACASLVVLSYPDLKVVYEECRMICLNAPYIPGFLAFRETPFLEEAVRRLQHKLPGLLPQVIFADGNGILHHREFGVACHLGVLTDLPCIGVAKNLLHVDGLEEKHLLKEKICTGSDLTGDMGAESPGNLHQTPPLDSMWNPVVGWNQGIRAPKHQVWDFCTAKIKDLHERGKAFTITGISGKVLGMALKSCEKSTKPIYVSVGHRISLDTATRLTYSCCKYRVPEPIRQADIRSREYIRKNINTS